MLKFRQRKAVEVDWTDAEGIEGQEVSVEAAGQEKRVTQNDGNAVVTFPDDFTGDCEITIRGTQAGEATGTVKVV